MEDEGRGLAIRMPKRQLVYPFVELQYQEPARGGDSAEIQPPFMNDRLISSEAKPSGLDGQPNDF
jgi:hypothetical protein